MVFAGKMRLARGHATNRTSFHGDTPGRRRKSTLIAYRVGHQFHNPNRPADPCQMQQRGKGRILARRDGQGQSAAWVDPSHPLWPGYWRARPLASAGGLYSRARCRITHGCFPSPERARIERYRMASLQIQRIICGREGAADRLAALRTLLGAQGNVVSVARPNADRKSLRRGPSPLRVVEPRLRGCPQAAAATPCFTTPSNSTR